MSKHIAALSSALFTLAWWKASAIRAARTAVMIAIPYVGTAVLFNGVPWLAIVSAAGLGAVASLVTSLAGIPEADGGHIPVWLALLERTTKTVAQGLAVGIGNSVLFTDVHWSTILQSALIAGLGSLLLGVLGYLPEAQPVDAPVPVDLSPTSLGVVTSLGDLTVTTPADQNQPAAGTPPSV